MLKFNNCWNKNEFLVAAGVLAVVEALEPAVVAAGTLPVLSSALPQDIVKVEKLTLSNSRIW